MKVRPYTADLEPAVKALNQRLRAGGERYWAFPESHIPKYPRTSDECPYQELFLTCDDGGVRGGYMLTHSRFAIRGNVRWIACGPQFSLSEGIVNHSYGLVGAIHLRDAIQRQPCLYGLGMGGIQQPIARMLAAMKWTLHRVPFYFKVLNVGRFVANISYLRKSQTTAALLDIARYTGAAWAGIRVAQMRLRKPKQLESIDTCERFDSWADDLWNRCKDKYSMVAAKDSVTLNHLYPTGDPSTFRLRISRQGKTVGWAVVRDSQMFDHKHFGGMRVGSIVDCMAEPHEAGAVARCSTEFLEQRGVDLIVSNQVSSAWGTALMDAGFLSGPSNFILALSPRLAARLSPLDRYVSNIHMNRGDGDGPIHL